jgi:hypothetical protein
MKKLFLGALLSLSILSCNNVATTETDGFSTKLDTIYKDNSTEVESITRTIYQKGERTGSYFGLSQTLGEKDYVISYSDGESIGNSIIILLNEKEYDFFIESCKTLFKNKGKSLRYDIGDLKNVNISLSGDEINFFGQTMSDQTSVSYSITETDFNNLINAVEKYKAEKK